MKCDGKTNYQSVSMISLGILAQAVIRAFTVITAKSLGQVQCHHRIHALYLCRHRVIELNSAAIIKLHDLLLAS